MSGFFCLFRLCSLRRINFLWLNHPRSKPFFKAIPSVLALSFFSFTAQGADFIIDNTDFGAYPAAGIWWTAFGGTDFEGSNHVATWNGYGSEWRWQPDLAGAEAEYDVYVKYAKDWFHLGTDAPYTVVHDGGSDLILVDQTQNGGQWVLLGRFSLSQGSYVALGDGMSNDKRPSVDAVRFASVNPAPDEIIIDNSDPDTQIISGIWWTTTGGIGYEGSDHITSENLSGGEFRWTPNLVGAEAEYDVYVKYAVNWPHLGTDAPYTVWHDNGIDLIRVDQTVNGGQWFLLGRFPLSQGSFISLGDDLSNNKRPSADAVRFVKAGDLPPPPPTPDEIIIDNTDPEAQVISGDWWTLNGGVGYEGSNHITSDSSSGGEFRWTPGLAGAAGEFDVYVKYATNWWHLGPDAPYTVVHDRGSEVITVDQTINGGDWFLLGRYSMSLGSYISIEATLSNNKRPSADAVRLVRVGEPVERRLNFVVILTDDQRWDSVDEMPIVLNKIADRGIRFENAFVSTPLCGAVRANIISGGFYSSNHGILSNPGVNGGEVKFRDQDSDTIATALQQVGYKTMFAGGKYMNGYKPPYIPPGWTRFVNNKLGPCCSGWFNFEAIVGSSGTASSTGVTVPVSQYVVDYHKDEVLDFLDDYNGSDFLVFFSTFAPHAPAIPDTPDEVLYPNHEYLGRAVGETDLSDKPTWVANPNRFLSIKVPEAEDFSGKQLRSLQSVDRAVGAIVDKIEAMGELDRTVFIFTSDNGYLWGEHGLYSKGMAYDESIRVPFIVAAPGVLPGTTDTSLVMADLDLGATIFDMVGLNKVSDGQSFAPILTDPNAPFRSELFFQHWGYHEGAFGTWSAIRTDQFKYIENAYGEQELYDLVVDPYEEESLHNDPNFSVLKSQLSQTLSNNRGLGLRTFNPPNGTVGQGYNLQLETWGGLLPFSWYITTGSLPNGLTLNAATGRISGTPTTAGTFYAEIAVEDSSIAAHSGMPQKMVGKYTIIVNP